MASKKVPSPKRQEKSAREFAKVWRKRNLVKASDPALPPPAPDYSQPQGNAGESKSQAAKRSASYTEAHPSPPDVTPTSEAVSQMADPYQTSRVADHERAAREVAAGVVADTTRGPAYRTTYSNSSPQAVAAAVGQPPMAMTLADVVAVGMRSTGRR